MIPARLAGGGGGGGGKIHFFLLTLHNYKKYWGGGGGARALLPPLLRGPCPKRKLKPKFRSNVTNTKGVTASCHTRPTCKCLVRTS